MKDNYTGSLKTNTVENSEVSKNRKELPALPIIIGVFIVPLVVFSITINYDYIIQHATTSMSYVIGIVLGADFVYAVVPLFDDFKITDSLKKRLLVFVILLFISLYFVMFFNLNLNCIMQLLCLTLAFMPIIVVMIAD